jgi:hypothetical protein
VLRIQLCESRNVHTTERTRRMYVFVLHVTTIRRMWYDLLRVQCGLYLNQLIKLTFVSYWSNVTVFYTNSKLVVFGEGPRRRCYGRTPALRLIVQPFDEDKFFLLFFFRVMEWNCQGNSEVLGEKPIPVPLRLPEISHGLAWDRKQNLPRSSETSTCKIMVHGIRYRAVAGAQLPFKMFFPHVVSL